MSKFTEEVVRVALTQVGIREQGENQGPEILRYMQSTWMPEEANQKGYAWCSAFVCWVVKEAAFNVGFDDYDRYRGADAYGWEKWAAKKGMLVLQEDAPCHKGDLVTYDFSHIGIVVENRDFVNLGDMIYTVEGNAQPLDSAVLTPSGWEKMGNVRVGMPVTDPYGEESTVLGVFPQKRRPIYRVTLSDGSTAECCDQHLWSLYDVCSKKGKLLNLLQIGKYLQNKHKLLVPFIHPVEYEQKKYKISPYLLGALLGDGGLSGPGVRFTCEDQSILSAAKAEMDDCYDFIHVGKNKNLHDYLVVGKDANGNSLAKYIKDLGLNGKRSHEKFIPYNYLCGASADRLALLQGLLDTDGHIDAHGRIEYSTCSRQLWDDVHDLILGLGGKSGKHIKTNIKYTSPNQKTPKPARDAYRLQNIRFPILPKLFRCKRKIERLRQKSFVRGWTVKDIEYVRHDEAQCIKVSSESNLYITDNYIATHNTNKAGEREGDGVWRKARKRELVKSFIRLE